MVVILKLSLTRDTAKAVSTQGVANPEGPADGEMVEAPTCAILVFITSGSGGRLGLELMDHFEDFLSTEQVAGGKVTVERVLSRLGALRFESFRQLIARVPPPVWVISLGAGNDLFPKLWLGRIATRLKGGGFSSTAKNLSKGV